MNGTSKYLPLMLGLFSTFSALLAGLAATTANPIVILLIISAFGGIFLLLRPKWTMWIVLTLGLFISGTLPLWIPSLSKLGWGVSMLGLLLFAGAAFEQITRYQNKSKTPLFIKIALVFFAYTLIISVIQWYSPGELFSAVKRYYQVWGLMLALAWLAFSAIEIQRIQRLIFYIALVQLPFALYELLKFVPMRKGFVGIINGIVPVDIVAGTFGGEILGGGNNAEMATFLIIIFAFLLSRWRNGLLTTRRLISYSLPILLPLFLGETKIVVVLLPVMFLGLYGNQILRRPIQGLVTIGMTASLTILAGYVYVVIIINKPLQYVINDTIGYNFEARAYSTNNLLNRTTVISFWWKKHLTDPAHMLFGHGLGSAQSGGASNIPGHIAEHYLRYGIDLTGAAQLLWETGLLGFSLYILIILTAWFLAKKLLQKTTDVNFLADLAAIKAVLPIFFIYLFYRGALLETLTFQIIFFLLLGYLAFIFQHIEPTKLGNKIGIPRQ
jgi:hypothetical protein